jgi:hypothetical protein
LANWSRVPDECLTPKLTGRLTVGRNITLTLTLTKNHRRHFVRPYHLTCLVWVTLPENFAPASISLFVIRADKSPMRDKAIVLKEYVIDLGSPIASGLRLFMNYLTLYVMLFSSGNSISTDPCIGGLEYFQRNPASRKRRQKGIPMPGGITWPPCSWGI